jgi:hypothetical protein
MGYMVVGLLTVVLVYSGRTRAITDSVANPTSTPIADEMGG